MPFASPEDAATAAVIAMLLEVSGNPKAGNVDREHDLGDLRYEHFLVSAAASFPALLRVAESGEIGKGVFEAVQVSKKWHEAGNVHFGSFLLLIPLLTAWKSKNMDEVMEMAVENLRKSTWEDSIYVLEAYRMSGARVMDVEELSIRNSETERVLEEKQINLYEWMLEAPEENLIARELTGGYRISREGASFLLSSEFETNDSIVYLYYCLLAKHPDPLVISKAGSGVAREIMMLAERALNSADPFAEFERIDTYLLQRNLNPGTIADLVASSIYLALLEGWRV